MLDRLLEPAFVVRTLTTAGLIRPERPDRLVRGLDQLRRWGPTVAGGYASAAIRHPNDPAIVDERGSVTFAEVERRANAVARGLAARGVNAGDGVAILARNHRGFVEATAGVAKLGAHALYLNTMFAAPADRRRLRARAAGRDHPRRGVHGARRRRGARAVSGSSPGPTGPTPAARRRSTT